MFKVHSSQFKVSRLGNTLIEVLIAITLVGLLITPIMLSINNINKRHLALAYEDEANLIAQSNLEILTNMIESSPSWPSDGIPIPDQPETFEPRIPHHHWRLVPIPGPVPADNPRYTMQLTIQPVCRDSHGELAVCPADHQDPIAIEAISESFWQWAGQPRRASIHTIYANLKSPLNRQ